MTKHAGRFVDQVRIFCKAGRGGSGMPNIRGKGGQGGNVYLEVSEKATLAAVAERNPTKRFLATHGQDSSRRGLLGLRGRDITIPVPSGITASLDCGRLLGELNRTNDKLLVAKGGAGGGPDNGYCGQLGESHCVTLDLKLLADVGLVGFPNAGKSTLLSTVSRAKPRIADYVFTTLQPHLGHLQYASDGRCITMADLPGLIEGAHVNVGMGHHFLKHLERTKCLLFVVDGEGFQFNVNTPYRSAFETVLLLNRELELFKPELLTTPALCVINKIDLPGCAELAQVTKEMLEHMEEEVCNHRENYDRAILPNTFLRFDQVFLISAKQKEGVEELKAGIRWWLDEYARRRILAEAHDSQLSEEHPAFMEHMPSLI